GRGAVVGGGEGDWAPGAAVEFPSAPKACRPTGTADTAGHLCGFAAYSEYVSFQGSPSAQYFAAAWWRTMADTVPVPTSVVEALARQDEIDPVSAIVVARDGQWWRIAKRRVQRADGTVIEADGKYRVRRLVA